MNKLIDFRFDGQTLMATKNYQTMPESLTIVIALERLKEKHHAEAIEICKWLEQTSPKMINEHDAYRLVSIWDSRECFKYLREFYREQTKTIDITVRYDEPSCIASVCGGDGHVTSTRATDWDYEPDEDVLDKLKRISQAKQPIRIQYFQYDQVRHGIFNDDVLDLLIELLPDSESESIKIETLSLLHFKYKNNTLIISEQPLEVSRNHIRYIHYLKRNEIAQWCADNSPLHLKNTDAINLLNSQEWSDDYCLSFLADVKKDYKKPMPKQNDEYAIVEPVSTYRMTFYCNGQSYSYEHYEPFYFVRKCEPTEQYPLGFEPVIGKPHNAVALATNGDKYVMLAPCTIEEIKSLWTVTRPDNYTLQYKGDYVMDFDSATPCVNLVNWFLETQPILTDEQWQIIDDSADILNTLKLFKAMYK